MRYMEFVTLSEPSSVVQCWKGHFTSIDDDSQLLINRGLRLEICHWNQDHLVIDHYLTSPKTQVLFSIPLHRPELWPLDFVLYCTCDHRWILTQWTGLDFENQEFPSPGQDEVSSEVSKQRIDGFINTSVQWRRDIGLLFVQFRHGWIVSIQIEAQNEGFPNLRIADLDLRYDLERGVETSNSALFLSEHYWQNCIVLQMELRLFLKDYRLLLLMKAVDSSNVGSHKIIEINFDENFTNSIICVLELHGASSLLLMKNEWKLETSNFWLLGKNGIPVISTIFGNSNSLNLTPNWRHLEGDPNCYENLNSEIIILATNLGKFYLMNIKEDPILTPIKINGFTTCPSMLTLINPGHKMDQQGILFVAGRGSNSMLFLTDLRNENCPVFEKWKTLQSVIAIDNLSPIRNCRSLLDPLGSHELQLLILCGKSPFGAIKKCSLSYSIQSLSIAPTKLPNGVQLLKSKAKRDDPFDRYLCMSYNDGISQWSRILDVNNDSFSMTELPGFDSSHFTLLLESIKGSRDDLLLQVTCQEVRIIDVEIGVLSIWTEFDRISKSCFFENYLALGSVDQIVLLKLESQEIIRKASIDQNHQTSALEFLNFENEEILFLAIGEWTNTAIKIHSIPDLVALTVIPTAEFQPRSILMSSCSSLDQTRILVGTNTGSVLCLEGQFTPEGQFSKTGSSICQIGRTEVNLKKISDNRILAFCDQASVLELEQGFNVTRVFLGRGHFQSMVVLSLQALDPESLGWITESGELRFGRLHFTKQLNWTTLQIRDTPVQSLHHQESGSVLISCLDDLTMRFSLLLIEPYTMKIILSWDLPPRYILDSMMTTKLPFFTPESGVLHPEEEWRSFVLIWTHVEDIFGGSCNAKLSIFEICVSPVFEGDGILKKELILIGSIPLPDPVFCSGVAFASTVLSTESMLTTVLLKNGPNQESCSCKWTGNWPVIITGKQDGLCGMLLAIQDLNSSIQKNSITGPSSCTAGENLEQQDVQILQQGRIYYHSITTQLTTGPITGLSCKESIICSTGFFTSTSIFILEMKSELEFTQIPCRSTQQLTREALVLDDSRILLLGEDMISVLEIRTQYDYDALARGEDDEIEKAAFEEICESSNSFALFSGLCPGRLGLDSKTLEAPRRDFSSDLVFYTSTGGVYANNNSFFKKKV